MTDKENIFKIGPALNAQQWQKQALLVDVRGRLCYGAGIMLAVI